MHHDHPSSLNRMAASATLHCLFGCAIGEVAGLMIGVHFGLDTAVTISLAISLAFMSGYALSTLPLVRHGMTLSSALKLVLAADTLSIVVMEIMDNLTMLVIPGAMEAGLNTILFWVSMAVALAVAFMFAYPVNRYLLTKGKGHALTHDHMNH